MQFMCNIILVSSIQNNDSAFAYTAKYQVSKSGQQPAPHIGRQLFSRDDLLS